MTNVLRDQTRATCEQNGIHWARSVLPTRMHNDSGPLIAEWIDENETNERKDLEAKQLALATESARTAAISAQAALDSALHAADSAKATRLAVGFAAIAAVAAVGQAIASFR